MARVLASEPFLKPPAGRWPLVVALFGSGVLHALLVALAPPLGSSPLPPVVYTEVELLRMPETPPLVRRTPASPPERAPQEKVWRSVESKAAALLERQALEALRRARTKSLGRTLDYPGLALTLPRTPAAEPEGRTEPSEAQVLQEALARAGRAVLMPGVPTGEELLAEPGTAGERKPFAVASEAARRLARRLLEAELARKPSPAPPSAKTGITGPAARRHVLYRPAAPKVTVERETAVLLKFWVRPDGTVGRVVPLRKGDPRLEAVAVRFLKGWRFNALSEQAEEQWGTIPIVFRRP
ncbi:MAG: energy transducer TonB [Candidatus Tectimicrobiota bacterium]